MSASDDAAWIAKHPDVDWDRVQSARDAEKKSTPTSAANLEAVLDRLTKDEFIAWVCDIPRPEAST